MIPLHDVVDQNRSIRPEIDAAISRVLDSGILLGGASVAQFESSFSNYLGINHSVGIGNATDGFEIAYKALDLEAEDEVIIPANGHVSPALAAMNAGLKPVFCDVDEERMLINSMTTKPAITAKTKAIVAVHLFGRVCLMDELMALCDAHNLILIEDFSQAHGAEFNGQKVGSLGKINVCSFYPTKPLGALGDGGAITTNDPELALQCRQLSNYGWKKRDNTTVQGLNSRLDAMQAAVLSVKLDYLDQWNAARIERAKELIEKLLSNSSIRLEDWVNGDICHLFPIRSNKRENVISKLNAAGIESGIHYPIPIYKQNLFSSDQNLQVAEKICNSILSIPLNDGVISALG